MKQRNITENLKHEACEILESIASATSIIRAKTEAYNEAVADLANQYNQDIAELIDHLGTNEKNLLVLMKRNRGVLFDGTDVVNLPPGSLIRVAGERVSIPKTALAECEAQGFDDVIKIVKSLDRDAIEQWPDAKLVLIGAARKPKEDFKYSLKEK